MTTLLLWRLAKLLGLAAFAAGLHGALFQPRRGERLRCLYGTAIPGFLALWIAGYATMKLTGTSMGVPWISWTLVVSLLALHTTVHAAHHGGRVVTTTAVAGLLACVGVMVVRPLDAPMLVGLTAAAVPAATWLTAGLPTVQATDDEVQRALAGFERVATWEGLSLIALMLIATPLKYGAGVHVDGGTGVLGWTHGALLLVFLSSLAVTGRTLAWTPARMVTAFATSLVPFGTFWFTRSLRAQPAVRQEA